MSSLVLYCRMEEENILKELLGDAEWEEMLEEGEIPDQKENLDGLQCPVVKCKDKTFKNLFTLQRHWTEIHTKQINLKECSECQRLFRRPSDVKKHALKFHGKEVEARSVKRDNKFYIDPEGKSVTPRWKARTDSLKRPLVEINAMVPKANATTSQTNELCVPVETVTKEQKSNTTPITPVRQGSRAGPSQPKKLCAPVKSVTKEQGSSAKQVQMTGATSQIALVPGAHKVGQQAPLPTSRDLLLKHVMHARSQLDHWTKVEKEARDALAKFDREKQQCERMQNEAKVKELERLLSEERNRRREAESKARRLEQQNALKEKMDFIDFLQANEHFNKF